MRAVSWDLASPDVIRRTAGARALLVSAGVAPGPSHLDSHRRSRYSHFRTVFLAFGGAPDFPGPQIFGHPALFLAHLPLLLSLALDTPPYRGLCTYLDDGVWEWPIPNPAWRGDKRRLFSKYCAMPKPLPACHGHCRAGHCAWHCYFGPWASVLADPADRFWRRSDLVPGPISR